MVTISQIRVQNYKSIIDSGWVEINSRITTIVGPNEAGKSNFLQVISTFFDPSPYNTSDLSSYNRSDWETDDKSDIPIISIEFSDLEVDEFPWAYIDEIDKSSGRPLVSDYNMPEERDMDTPIVDNPSIIITKYSDGSYQIRRNEDGEDVEMSKFMDEKVQVANRLVEEILKLYNKYLEDDVYTVSELDELSSRENYTGILDIILDSKDKISTYSLEKIQSPDFEDIKLIRSILEEIEENREEPLGSLSENEKFEDIEELPVSSSFDTLNGGKENPYRDLLEYSGLEPNQIETLSRREIHNREQNAERTLSSHFNEVWDQADVDLNIQLDPSAVSLHIYESGTHSTVSDRSTGMRWFLSFFLRLVTFTENNLEDNLILLDDPGVHLHPEGHRNLLDAFENIANNNQIIYCTHSPSLIDNDHIERIRVFERSPESGTNIKPSLKDAAEDDDPDVLAPVRQSLGADISGSLFGSTKNVLVEGNTDKLYLNTFNNYFRRQDQTASFDYQTGIVDVDGSKAEYMVRFLDAEGYDYAIVLDDDHREGAKSQKEVLVNKGVDSDDVILVSEVIDDTSESANIEIEDLLPAKIFCEAVIEEYPHDGISRDELIDAADHDHKTMPNAVKAKLQEIEQGELDAGAFDKGDIAERVCDWIVSEKYSEDELGEDTLDAFESLILEINNRLSESD